MPDFCRKFAVVCCAAVSFVAPVLGEIYEWQGPLGNSTWETPSNWQITGGGTGVPSTSDADVFITTTNPADNPGVTLVNGAFEINSLQVGSSNSLTLDSGNVGVLSDYHNDGTIQLNNATLTFGTPETSTFTLEGSGNLILQGSAGISTAGTTLVNGAQHRITGSGMLGFGGFRNDGTIDANDFFGWMNLHSAQNENLIQASNFGELRIYGEVTQGTGGRIKAAGGFITLGNSSKIVGGKLESTPGSEIVNSGSSAAFNTLDNVTIEENSTYRIVNGSGTAFLRETTNNGTIRVEGIATLGTTGNPSATLRGTGMLELSGGNFVGESGAVHEAGHTIQGSGRLSGQLVNYGTIKDSSASSNLALDSMALENRGLITASSGGVVAISSFITQTSDGSIRAENGDVILLPGSKVKGGKIESATGEAVSTQRAIGHISGGLNRLDDITVTSGSTYRIWNGDKTVFEGETTNNGLIRVEGIAGFVTLESLRGTGTLELAGGVIETADASLTHELGHTIRGNGRLGYLINQGTIRDSNSSMLSIGYLRNENLILASSGGSIHIDGHLTQSATGVVRANGGTVILRAGSKVSGGTLETGPDGGIKTDGPGSYGPNVLSGVTIAADSTYEVLDGDETIFEKEITNNGTILANGLVRFWADGAVQPSLAGNGALEMKGVMVSLDAPLTQQTGHTIKGYGVVFGSLVNHGVVSANENGMTLTVVNDDPWVNYGRLEAINGGTLQITGDAVNNGVMLAKAGVLIVDGALTNNGELRMESGGTIQFTNGVVLEQGTLGGSGTYSAAEGLTLGDAAKLAPGNSPGTIYVEGNFTLSSGTEVEFELAQPGIVGGGINDFVSVDGDLSLDGELTILSLAGFGTGTYRLFEYSGDLLAQSLDLTITPPGYLYALDYSTPSQVNLVVSSVPEPSAIVLILAGASLLWRRRRSFTSPRSSRLSYSTYPSCDRVSPARR